MDGSVDVVVLVAVVGGKLDVAIFEKLIIK